MLVLGLWSLGCVPTGYLVGSAVYFGTLAFLFFDYEMAITLSSLPATSECRVLPDDRWWILCSYPPGPTDVFAANESDATSTLVAGTMHLPFELRTGSISLTSKSTILRTFLCDDSSLITCVYLSHVPGGVLVTHSLWACSFSFGFAVSSPHFDPDSSFFSWETFGKTSFFALTWTEGRKLLFVIALVEPVIESL